MSKIELVGELSDGEYDYGDSGFVYYLKLNERDLHDVLYDEIAERNKWKFTKTDKFNHYWTAGMVKITVEFIDG
jgi:hypothetical protein